MFMTVAKINNLITKWDVATRQVFSIEEGEIDEYLADDDELNKTDVRTAEKPVKKIVINNFLVQTDVPQIIDSEKDLKMYTEDDSVSTFYLQDKTTVSNQSTPSTRFTPKVISMPPIVQIPSDSQAMAIDVDNMDEDESISKLSDTESRISTL